ncbi:MAG: hypothetical protein JRG96_03565 [Deltaproteobacteria bacterium]|nr:hypothetical protein [Deltaproteobacteria bacterium]MBW2417399.1 hypothetical protein [Deltaproteobacteria bacterium]
MFLPNSAVPVVSEASIQALCPSLNTPVLNIEQLPVGPARAAILLFGGEDGDVCLAVGLRSLETSEVVVFSYQGDACDFSTVDTAVGAALSFAEGMGFLFEDDLVAQAGPQGQAQAARVWESLARDTEAELGEPESAVPDGTCESTDSGVDEELALLELADDGVEPAADDAGAELLLEESVPEAETSHEAMVAAAEEAVGEVVGDEDAEALRVTTNQTRILTKFRGSGAAPSPVVHDEVLPEVERLPLASVAAGRERRPKLLARLLGSF